MKNIALISGTAKNVHFNEWNGKVFANFSVTTVDPDRKRTDGTPFTYNVPVSASGPVASRLKEKNLQDGMPVLVEGRLEPQKDKNGVMRYPVNANKVDLVDNGSINHIILQGRLVRDPEVRTTSKGEPVSSVSIACERRWMDKSSNGWKATTSFIGVSAWDELANSAAEFSKGQMVWVTGKLTTRKYTKDGVDLYPVEVIAKSIAPGGTNKFGSDSDANASAKTGAVESAPPVDLSDVEDEDLPF